MSKVYGYVLINKETGEQWGTVYASKQGAALSYNQHFYNCYWRENRHKFADQDLYERRELVLKDE